MPSNEATIPYVPDKKSIIATRKRADGAEIQEVADTVMEARITELKTQNAGLVENTAALNATMGLVRDAQVTSNQGMVALGQKVDALKASTDSGKTSTDGVKTAVDSLGAKIDTLKTSQDAVKTSVDAMTLALNAQTALLQQQLAATQAQSDQPRTTYTAAFTAAGASEAALNPGTGAATNQRVVGLLMAASASLLGSLFGTTAQIILYHSATANGNYNGANSTIIGTFFVAAGSTVALAPGVDIPQGRFLKARAAAGGVYVTAITRPV